MASARLTPYAPVLACVAIASIIGTGAWTGAFWRIGLTVLVPVLVFAQQSRSCAAVVAFAYFGAASWPMIAAAASFHVATPPVLWFVASAILASPWLLLWPSDRSLSWWRCPLALFLSAVPPIGLVGWASPLVSAGVLFPGMAWFGLAAVALLPGLVLRPATRFATLAAAIMLSVLTNQEFTTPIAPRVFAAVSTSLGNPTGTEMKLQADERLQLLALQSASRVTILPEAVVGRWTEATEAFWAPTIDTLTATDRSVLVGVGLPVAGSDEYRNALIPIGAEAPQPFIQRIPVPFGMWKPFGPKNGVPLHLLGPGTLAIRGERVGIIICYEQLLVWPILLSAVEHPTLLIGVANECWTKQTLIPSIQRASLRAWSRLFSLPLLTATND